MQNAVCRMMTYVILYASLVISFRARSVLENSTTFEIVLTTSCSFLKVVLFNCASCCCCLLLVYCISYIEVDVDDTYEGICVIQMRPFTPLTIFVVEMEGFKL